MKADPFQIGDVLKDPKRFVPIYQRTYAWQIKPHLETFFGQVETKAEERLKSNGHYLHYMGAILIIPRAAYLVGRMAVLDVVDGQQRLTFSDLPGSIKRSRQEPRAGTNRAASRFHAFESGWSTGTDRQQRYLSASPAPSLRSRVRYRSRGLDVSREQQTRFHWRVPQDGQACSRLEMCLRKSEHIKLCNCAATC